MMRKLVTSRYFWEMVVIFLGITLSLLAEDWREYSNARADEEQILYRMSIDLETDYADLVGNLERARSGHDAAAWLRDNWDNGSITADSTAAAIQTVFQRSVFVANNAEYAALKSGGELKLILEPDLRRSITTLYESHNIIHTVNNEDKKQIERLKELLALNLMPRSAKRFHPPPGFTMVGDWRQLLRDPLFRNTLLTAGAVKQQLVDLNSAQLEHNIALRQRIKQLLDERS